MTDIREPEALANRRISTDDIAARIAAAYNEPLARQELTLLETDAITMLQHELRNMLPAFREGVLPGHDPELVVRDACTTLVKTEGLWEADPASIFGAAMTAAQLGLRIDVLGQSWILPFWDTKRQMTRAQLMIGYQGYVSMCFTSGRVVEMCSEPVYQREADNGGFTFHRTEAKAHLYHRPDMSIASRYSCPQCNETDPTCSNKDRHGEPVHAFYATARTKGGGYAVTRPWGLQMMREHRDRYAKRDKNGRPTPFWRDNFIAGGRKTMARELTRLLPKNREMANALHVDEGVRETFHPNTEPGEATVHEGTFTIHTSEPLGDDDEQGLHPSDRA